MTIISDSVATLGVEGHWLPVKDADPRVIALYERHYSASPRKKGSHKSGIAGPSERMVMLTVRSDALWVWRLLKPPEERASTLAKPDMRRIRRGNKPNAYFGAESGIMCSVFRNEGDILSSILVEEACQLAWQRWPGTRLFTYVWGDKVASVNPGYCFKKAGWETCGKNKDGRLTILERLPRVVE